MKTSSIVLVSIGVLLLLLQFLAYNGDPTLIRKPFQHNVKDAFSLTEAIGSFVGSNLFGLVGLVLLLIGLTSKRKIKSANEENKTPETERERELKRQIKKNKELFNK